MMRGDIKRAFDSQMEFQGRVTGLAGFLPVDHTSWFSYHVQAMVEEMGELLKADKRWKTHRNTAYDPSNKLEEIADVFITVMNLAIFSGVPCDELMDAVQVKIAMNMKKLDDERAKVNK